MPPPNGGEAPALSHLALSRQREPAEADEEEGENERTRRGTHTIRQYGEA